MKKSAVAVSGRQKGQLKSRSTGSKQLNEAKHIFIPKGANKAQTRICMHICRLEFLVVLAHNFLSRANQPSGGK